MKLILRCCFMGIFIQILVEASPLCPQNFTYVSNNCIYAGPKTDWFVAAHQCSLFESTQTLINMKEDYLQHITAFLLRKEIVAVWIGAKRNGPYEPIIYQLPSSPFYGTKLSDFKQTNEIWLQNEPSHKEEESCMVLMITNTSSGNELRAKMDRCNEPLYNYVCIRNPCDNDDKVCQQKEVKENRRLQEIKPSIVPKMEIRKENNRYFLEVYNPERLWNFTNSTHQKIKNPVCMLEDGNMEVNIMAILDPKKKLTWTVQNITDDDELKKAFRYCITKQIYRIIIETEGYFVCQAFIADTMEKITTEKTIYRTDLNRYIFVMSLVYSVPNCSLEVCEPTYSKKHWVSLAQNLRETLKLSEEFKSATVQAVRMTSRTGNKLTLTFRVKILTKTSIEDVNADYTHLSQLRLKMKSIVANNTDGLTDVLYIRSSKFCHEEETNGNQTLHWRTATIGELVSPTELCIDEDGTLVQRKCNGDIIIGAFWSAEEIYECVKPSAASSYLFSLREQRRKNRNATEILEKLNHALANQDLKNDATITRFARVDIQSVAKTMFSLQDDGLHDSDIPLIANITDTIMKIASAEKEVKALRNFDSQKKLNASNAILESLDHMFNLVKLSTSEVLTVTPRFVSLVMDIEPNSHPSNNIRGLAAMRSSKHPHFIRENIVTLPWNTSLETLLNMDVSAAVFLPPQLISHLSSSLQTTDKGNSFASNNINSSSGFDISKTQVHRLVINMFWDDGLFKTANGTPLHIISVTVDGVKHQDLNPPLILLFDNSYTNASSAKKDCVFWDFKASAGLGNWTDIGCTLTIRSNETFSRVLTELCICTHLTHFGQLISPSLEEEINLALDIITIVGCSASLLGLFGIGLTALLIPDWRRGASKKIQLHLSTSLGILMSVFLINALIFVTPEDRVQSRMCLFMGVVLHFAVISTFCWMLVAAWFQYLRLTKPLASRHRTTHILLKSSIFAWGAPCIPCVILLTISPESYNSSQCYPTGMAHYLSVIIPIAIIISLNIWMYVLIVCSIYNLDKVGAHINLEFQYANNPKCQRSLACRRLTTLVFLFFLLGLSWLFGIWKLSYLFCCTATLQGLAFFVFFVILEKNTRTKWVDLLMKKKGESAYPLSNRSSLGSTLKRWSHISRGTSRRTVSTVSSLS